MTAADRSAGPIAIDAIAEAIAAFHGGEIVLLVHEPTQAAAVAVAADHVSAAVLERLSSVCNSAIFLVATRDRLDALGIGSMAATPTPDGYRDFGVSINAAGRTGLTLEDRAEVFRRVISPLAVRGDFTWPGHTIPILARSRGLLARQTVTEGALDLARLAGLAPASALCLIYDQGGSPLSAADLRALQARHGVTMLSVEALYRHRLLGERFVESVTECDLPVAGAVWRLIAYRDVDTGRAYMALVRRGRAASASMPLYVQPPCGLGLVLGAPTCTCRADLDDAIARMSANGGGIVVHIDASDISDRLLLEIAADAASDAGGRHHHGDVDDRDFLAVGWILRDLGIHEVEVRQMDAGLDDALTAHRIRRAPDR